MNVITNNNIRCTIALAALESVMDPEIGQIDFDETEKKIYVTMTLTTQFCPMGESIAGAVKRVLESTFIGEEVFIELSFDPPWNHERISEEGQQFLNK